MKQLSAPISVKWEVLPECNFKCIHCYNYWRDNSQVPDQTASFEELADITVDKFIKNNVLSVVITGGEPLIIFERLYPYLLKLKRAGISISLNSNLSLLTDEIADKLANLEIVTALVSLPSGNETINNQIAQNSQAFALTTNGIKKLVSRNISVSVNMVVTKLNLNTIFETGKFVKNLGVRFFNITKAVTPTYCSDFSNYQLSKDEFSIMIRELLRCEQELGLKTNTLEIYPYCYFSEPTTLANLGMRTCTAGIVHCTVDFTGDVRPCSLSSKSYGKIQDFEKIWNSFKTLSCERTVPPQCQGCVYETTCRGGCNNCKRDVSQSCDFSIKPIFSPIEFTHHKSTIPKESSLIFNPNIIVRDENFGAILYCGIKYWIPVDFDLLSFFNTYHTKSFSVNHMKEFLGICDEEVNQLITYLLKRKIVIQC